MISIDYTLILVVLNFIVLLIILNKLLYKPINEFLNARKKNIEADLDDAQKMKTDAENLLKKQEEELKNTTLEIRNMKNTAKKEASFQADDILKKAKDHEKRILLDTEQQLAHEKDKTINEIKEQMSDLVANLSGKFLKEKIDSGKDKKIISELLNK